ncbi:hypothetical protein FRC08_017569 [Ceratobasidium sp. 394]|nr:hypothetical protein FRC08_017569 [Ceratobasidium sp. 394]
MILRVVPPRPRVEDLVLQLLGNLTEHGTTQDSQKQDKIIPADPTPDFDISERLAREMQEQEDREQEMMDRRETLGRQMGEFMSSVFGGLYEAGGNTSFAPRQQNVNAEAGPSTVKPKPSFQPTNGLASPSMEGLTSVTEADPAAFDESSKGAGKQRARQSPAYPLALNSNSVDLLDNAEATLRHQVNKFDFPEHLDFLDSAGTLGDSLLSEAPPAPMLAHTINNAPVHAHERALSNLLANLDAVANDDEEEVRVRRLQIIERIKQEMEELDRRVIELWAAGRRYTPRVGRDA